MAHGWRVAMIYDVSRFTLKDTINNLIPAFRQDFINAHSNTDDIPLYQPGAYAKLDLEQKWKMSVVKNMGVWEPGIKTKYPNLYNFIEQLGDTCRSAGYSVLEPGGNVLTHTDTEEGHENYVIVHVPLIVPKGDVGFIENDKKGKWTEGECFILDVESPHSVWNRTTEPRVVILLELLKEVVYV